MPGTLRLTINDRKVSELRYDKQHRFRQIIERWKADYAISPNEKSERQIHITVIPDDIPNDRYDPDAFWKVQGKEDNAGGTSNLPAVAF